MSADELRQAAETLRSRATWFDGKVTAWTVAPDGDIVEVDSDGRDPDGPCYVGCTYSREDAEYIATMHPGVGLALADWLDSVARVDLGRGQRETHEGCDNDCDVVRALVVARLINGGGA